MQLALPKSHRKVTYLSGICLALFGLGFFAVPHLLEGEPRSLSAAFLPLPNHMEITVFSNDSTTDFTWTLTPVSVWDSAAAAYSFDFVAPDLSCLHVIWDSVLTAHHWDTLPQIRFWRKVMTLSKDSAIINIASSRKMLATMPVWKWEALGDALKERYRDSVRRHYHLDSTAAIFVTAGKGHYYQFERALPSIGRGIEAFRRRGVDPWYAQAILLIESPGQIHMSPVGAYGSFQLMESVALEHGLVVNDSLDEREDFELAAGAAADLIRKTCLPQIRWLLRKRNIEFSESDLWFRLLVLHAYHAGAGNVDGVLDVIKPIAGGVELMKSIWTTEAGGFKNASQNYSQVALASFLELDRVMSMLPDTVCRDTVFLWREVPTEGQMSY
ncbi:MAG: hypothetical protein NWR72_01500 [Bacteroidia bacterium]|nr:hypothetical protein [Bacteroidia bacterium]